MKKYVIAMAMLLTLSMSVEAAAQKHRHTPQADELVDSTSKNSLDAFSDTTTVWDDDSLAESDPSYDISVNGDQLGELFKNLRIDKLVGVVLLLGIFPLILFVIAPILILFLIFYFINKNRREKMKLAQMAIEHGQPIPDQLLKDDSKAFTDANLQSGIRQLFLGVGLMIFLGMMIGEIGFGIGALVACIGLGKIAIAWLNRDSKRPFENDNHNITDIQP